MSKALHCDREDCNTWERTEERLTEWWKVEIDSITRRFGEQDEFNFCTLECLAIWASRKTAKNRPNESWEIR